MNESFTDVELDEADECDNEKSDVETDDGDDTNNKDVQPGQLLFPL